MPLPLVQARPAVLASEEEEVAVRLADLVRGKGPLSERQVERVRRWLEEDWESHDHDRELLALVGRLVSTVKSKVRPRPRRARKDGGPAS